MSEAEPKTSAGGGGMLLEPEKKGLSSFLLPAALAAGGAALIYKVAKKKDDKKAKSSAPSAGSSEVVFSATHSNYSMGTDYEQLVLEPYLSEQAEDGDLHLKGQGDALSGGVSVLESTMIARTRKAVISAFKATHRVKVGTEIVQISSLPQGKTGVQKFNDWIEEKTKSFQENY